jgi:thioredoxin reductase
MDSFDAVVVGAGPAGLSAALILGRCRRRVLVCDAGHPRNAVSHALHGFLTRDGVEPAELRRVGREQLRRYSTVEVRDIEVVGAKCEAHGFAVTLGDGTALSCRKLLLATGVSDELPEIDGFQAFYGRSVFHCPYCDGWEVRDQPLAVYGSGEHGTGLALALTAWSADLVLCTDGAAGRPAARDVDRLTRHGIGVREEPIARLEGRDGMLERIVFTTGDVLERRAMFFSTGNRQGSDLAARLGCAFTGKGAVETGEYETTNIPGLYVAGDASRLVQLAIVAASEGAEAAFAMNTAMLKEDLAARERSES